MPKAAPDTTDESPSNSLEAASDSADQEFTDDDVGTTVTSCSTYIGFLVLDEDDQPVSDEKYRLVLPDGSVREGTLGSDGRIYVESIPPGSCRLSFSRMLAHGVPEDEVKRSWEWDAAQGQIPPAEASGNGGGS